MPPGLLAKFAGNVFFILLRRIKLSLLHTIARRDRRQPLENPFQFLSRTQNPSQLRTQINIIKYPMTLATLRTFQGCLGITMMTQQLRYVENLKAFLATVAHSVNTGFHSAPQRLCPLQDSKPGIRFRRDLLYRSRTCNNNFRQEQNLSTQGHAHQLHYL